MSTEWSDPSPAGGDDTPGRVLKARREQMGWSVEQVADQLKLATRQVVALEEGDYASLPPAAVVRGFVRAYAKVMKVDAAPLVAQIPVDAAAAAADASAGVRARPQSFSEVRFPTHGKRSRLPLVAGALAVLAIAALAVAWQAGLFATRTQATQSTEVAAPALPAANGTVTEPLAPPVDQGAGTLFPTQPAPAATAPAATQRATPAAPAATAPAATAPAQRATAPATPAATPLMPAPAATSVAPQAAAAGKGLVLNVSQESWVELTTASGKLLMARLAAPGTVESFDLREPVTLVVGNPAGVSATLKGASLPLPARRGTTVARVKINP